MNAVAYLIGIVIGLLFEILWLCFCYWLGGGIGLLIGIGISLLLNAIRQRST